MKITNMEHYRGEIEETYKGGYGFAVKNGKVFSCCDIKCAECEFNLGSCNITTVKWLMSEYKPEPVLTQREKHFVEFAQEGWIARDKNGEICLYFAKPQKSIHGSYWDDEGDPVIDPYIIANLFPFITWEDEEPWSVEELRKLKVQE